MRKSSPAYKALVESWRDTPLKEAPFIHKDDEILRTNSKNVCVYKNFEEYISSNDFGIRNDRKLHLGLLPHPYSGDLAKAKVFILMLNPGCSSRSYYDQQHKNKSRRNRHATLRQEHLNKKYPFTGLDPSRVWASDYWYSKFDDILRLAMRVKKLDYQTALSFLSRQVAVLQLYPYRSPSFSLPRKIRKQLKSSELIRKFVKETLLPEAKAGRILLIVTRKVKTWGLHRHKKVIVYKSGESRAASLSTKSRGGRAIAQHLGLLKS